jgi:PAS domain-containing protein
MNSTVQLVSWLYAGGALASLGVAMLTWRRHEVPGGRDLSMLLLAGGFWALCDALEVRAQSLEARRLISEVQYLGVVCVGPLFLRAALALGRVRARWGPGIRLAVWAIPLATLALAWTSASHGWLWTAIEQPPPGSPFASYRYGTWFWLFAAHQYALLALGSVVLLRAAARVERPYRTQMRLVAAALLIPWLGNLAYNTKLGPLPGLNWFSLSLPLFGAVVLWAVVGGGLLDLIPNARQAIVDRMGDGVLVVDLHDRVLHANRSARDMLGLRENPSALPSPLLRRPYAQGAPEANTIELQGAAGSRWIEVGVDPVRDRWGEEAGRVFVLRDRTARRLLEIERERLIEDLQRALAEVRTLEGMLPICASCKKVRDDRGYWTRIEEFLRAKAQVKFTHGICPECALALYGGALADDVPGAAPDSNSNTT